MTVAIPGQPRPYGVIGVHTRQHRRFSTDDIHFLRAVANLLAVAIKERSARDALRDSDARMRAIVNTAVDGIITIDQRGIMESVNPAATRLFGYSAEEMVGKSVNMLMPQPYGREHDGYIARYLATGHAKIIGIGREVVGLRKDGTVFPMDLAVSELSIAGRRMFTGVLRDITERRRLQQEILEASADEQRRIGQDLHDGLCQHLAGVAFATEVLRKKMETRCAPEAVSIAKVAELIDQAITQARELARGLQPVTLEAGGLAVALEALAEKVENLFQINCLFVSEGDGLVRDHAAATHLYRIAQEAISNAIKHGKARTVIIELTAAASQSELVLRITDDGIGLGKAASDGKGMGLRTMAYRASLIGGQLTVRPGDRGGSIVACVVRLKNTESANAEVSNGKAHAQQHQKRKSQQSRRREDTIRGDNTPGTAVAAGGGGGGGGGGGDAEERRIKDQNPRRRRPPDRP
jgi:PAS domain S-box-containing protein